jgi:large subunit ribosomal protein L13
VVVKNISKLKFTGHKFDQKVYYHYSGYPSGLKEKKLSNIFPKNPGDILKRAVWNMLPKNKLREKMFKRLKITK